MQSLYFLSNFLNFLFTCLLSFFSVPRYIQFTILQLTWLQTYYLEAELRRADQAECKGERKEHHSGVDQGAGSEPAPSHDTGKIDKLEALELQMRQRALQSLLAKKKEQKP